MARKGEGPGEVDTVVEDILANIMPKQLLVCQVCTSYL